MAEALRLLRRGGLCAAVLAAAAPAAAEPPPLPSVAAPGSPTLGADPLPFAEPGRGGGIGDPVLEAPVRLGILGFPAGALAPPPPGRSGQGWSVAPSLTLELLATDNLFGTGRNRQADFVTSVIPGLFVTADTDRVRGTVNYAPRAQFYAATPDQDRLDHRLNAQVLATLVPERFFLDLRGAAATQATTGGFAPEGTAAVDRRNRVQTTVFQVSPYVVHRFGDVATARLGYAFQYANQDGNRAFAQGSAQPYFVPQEFTAHEGYGVVRSGQDWGRFAFEGRVVGTFYEGTGVLDGAHRASAVAETRYAITRGIAALVEGGYEDQRYSGVPPVRISEPVWAVGARLAPNPESLIIVKYGHRDGFNSFLANGTVALGGRTRLFGSYFERLTTSAQRAADLLSTTTVDALGNSVDSFTGAPVVQPFANSFFAAQTSLQRVRAATASISQSWPRDTITLSVFHEERRPVSIVPGTVAFAQRGTSGRLSWTHALAPRTSTLAYLQYGRTRSSGFGSGEVFTAAAAVSYQFSPTLVGTLQYILTNRDIDGFSGGNAVQNVVLAVLRQSF